MRQQELKNNKSLGDKCLFYGSEEISFRPRKRSKKAVILEICGSGTLLTINPHGKLGAACTASTLNLAEEAWRGGKLGANTFQIDTGAFNRRRELWRGQGSGRKIAKQERQGITRR